MVRAYLTAGFVLLAAACGEDSTPSSMSPGTGVGDTAVADFALLDENPSSPSAGRSVSPRDHLMKVSGWYFTHAT